VGVDHGNGDVSVPEESLQDMSISESRQSGDARVDTFFSGGGIGSGDLLESMKTCRECRAAVFNLPCRILELQSRPGSLRS
jgi:hypothetical protein